MQQTTHLPKVQTIDLARPQPRPRAYPRPALVAAPLGRRLTRAVFHTRPLATPAFVRLVLGVAILPHGAQKLLGWFGGYGLVNTLRWFTDTVHIPWILGLAAIVVETLGGLALIAGFATRIFAAGLGLVFLSAAYLVHAQHGFFINWFGNQKGEGIEYFVLGLALVAIVVVQGGGAGSVDLALTHKTAADSALTANSSPCSATAG